MYDLIIGDINGVSVPVIDLRSDTVSKPTPEMREAMFRAEVGDDVFGEDPTVAQLEAKAARMVDKEDALFVVSGTMANLISIMVHCSHRGSELICGHNGHTFRFEQGGPAQIAGVQSSIIRNNEDGTFDVVELRDRIRKGPDVHEPRTELIVVENTHNMCGGKVLPLEWLAQVKEIASEYNIPIHMDGARLMNAAVYLNIAVKEITKHVDTVCFCLSKGLGAPIGSILAGSHSFIAKAKRCKKVLGGGWRQAGILAAAGIVALDTMIDRLQDDHRHAKEIATAIQALDYDWIYLDATSVHTNIVIVHLDASKVNAKDIQRRLQHVSSDDNTPLMVLCSSRCESMLRFVTYWQITDDLIKMAIHKISSVFSEFQK